VCQFVKSSTSSVCAGAPSPRGGTSASVVGGLQLVTCVFDCVVPGCLVLG
jgi:hypothetical protein